MNTDMKTHPSAMYLRIAEGPDDLLGERSRTRRAMALVAAVAVFVVSIVFAAGMQTSDWGPLKLDKALAHSGSGGGDDDHSGPGGGDDEDDDSGPGSDGRDDDDSITDRGTGVSSVGNTDTSGHETGKSTQGETDPGDHTGKTEATQGTGAESKGATDAPGADTGASTKGETDPGDDTGTTERR